MKTEPILYCLSVLLASGTYGQLRIEQAPLTPHKMNSGVFVYGANNLKREIPYSVINGSPFWKDVFLDATIILSDGKVYPTCPVKLNLATNELYFRDKNGDVLSAEPGTARQINIRDQGSSADIIFKTNIRLKNRETSDHLFVQELNEGAVQLLKVSKKVLKESDSLFGTTKKYSFLLEEYYYLKNGDMIKALKKLREKEIMSTIQRTKELEVWLKKNNLNFTNESDILKLLKFLNER